jgi:hypothetical protein
MIEAGGVKFSILPLGSAPAPKPQVRGDKVVVGNQTIWMEGGKMMLAK